MADPKIKFKRSSVQGKSPTATDLPLGEIAINTYDGIVYTAKSTDGGLSTSIVNVSGVQLRDEDTPVGYANTINFTGAGILASVQNGIGIVTVSSTGPSSQWITTATGIHTLSNVGIGTTNPTSKLTVDGDVNVSGISTTSTLNVGVGGTIITTTGIGSVGIGSTLPDSTLVVNAPSGYSGSVLNTKIGTDSLFSVQGQTFSYQTTNAGSKTKFHFGSFGSNSGWVGINYVTHTGPVAYLTSLSSTTGVVGVNNTGYLAWLSTTNFTTNYNNWDLRLYRDDTGVLAQRNSTSPNTFRVYNTYTSATDFERANVGWTTDTFIVGTEKGSAGGTARQLELQTDGTTRVAITTDGNVGIGSTQPTSALHVIGDVKITGVATATSFDGSGASLTSLNASNISSGTINDAYLPATISSDITGNAATATYATTAGVSTNVIGGISSVTQLSVSGISTLQNDVNIGVGGTTAFFDISTGYVGINTTNPLVALDVAGVIREELHSPTMPVGLNDDIGVNWTKIEMGAGLEYIFALVYCGNGIVLAGGGTSSGDGDIYRSTDFGLTWTQIEMGAALEVISSLVYCGNGIVLAGSGASSGDGDIYRSTDFGLTWTQIEMGSTLERIFALVYCGNGIVLAGSGFNTAGDGDIYRSTDFGQTFTQIEMGAALERIPSLVYCGNGIVLAGGGSSTDDGDIYRSTDFGLTWTQIEMGAVLEQITSLVYCGNGIVLAGSGTSNGDGDIYRSTDFGLTWTKIEMGSTLDYIISLVHCGNGIVLAGSGASAGDGDIYRSTDFGLTWTQIEMGAALEYIHSLVYCGNGIVLAGGGLDAGDGDIYRSDVGFSQASTIQGIYHEHLTGNIGIGSTQPTATLDVNGNVAITGIITSTGANITGVVTATTFSGSLNAANLTGTLGLSTGGTNASLVASNGGVVYSTASAMAILSGTATAGRILRSGASSAPSWSTATYPATTTINRILYSSAANTIGEITTANTSALVTNSTGVPSFASGTTANRVLRTNGTTVSFSQVTLTTDVTGTLPIANGGTNATATPTNGGVSYGTGTAYAFTSAGTSGQLLTSNGAASPTWSSNINISGIVTATDFNSTSDLKLKTNVQKIENPLDKIVKINGVTFNWKENNKQSIGVIAQEIEKVLPQLVSTGENKTVNYNGIIGLLIECVKEQQDQINELREELKSLKT